MEKSDQNKKRENLQKEKNQIFRLLPRVDDLMKKENVQRLAEKEGYERVLGAVRDSVENLRNEISQGIKKGISEHEAKEMIQKFLYEIESSSKKSEVKSSAIFCIFFRTSDLSALRGCCCNGVVAHKVSATSFAVFMSVVSPISTGCA